MSFAVRRTATPRRPRIEVAGVEIVVGWSATITAFLVGATVAEGVLPQAAPNNSVPAYWVAGAAAAVVYLLALVGHELSHALVARRFGVRVDRITLWMLGGMARMTSNPRTPGAEFAIAVAGPLASFAAAAVLYVAMLLSALAPYALVTAALAWLALANVILGAFNLIPAFPLDGGRVARSIAWKLTGSMHRATRGAALLGRLFGLALIVLGLYWLWFGMWVDAIWAMFLGWFLRQAASAEEVGEAVSSALAGLTVAEVMDAEPPSVPDWLTVEQALSTPALAQRSSALLVHGLEGWPTGLAPLRRLEEVPRETAGVLRVGAVSVPLSELPRFEVEEKAEDAVARLSAMPDEVGVVYSGERVVGLLTPGSVEMVVRRHQGQAA